MASQPIASRRRGIRSHRTAACAAALLLALPAAARGQAAGANGPGPAVRLLPRIGLLAPDAYLYEQYANFSGDGPVEWTSGALGRAVVAGLGVEIGRPGGALFLRAEVLRSFDAWLAVAYSIVVPRQLFDPPYVQTTWIDVPTAVTTTSVHLVVPTRLTLWRAQPYVLGGLGGKRYDFGEPTSDPAVPAILPASGFTWGGDVGAGFIVPIAGFDLDLQARDIINRYWGKTQNDFAFSAAAVWRVR